MRIFSPIIDPTSGRLSLSIPNDIHRRAVGPKPICHDDFWTAIPFHRFAQELQRSLAIPPFRDKDLEHFAFVINRAPEIMGLAIDTNEHFVWLCQTKILVIFVIV